MRIVTATFGEKEGSHQLLAASAPEMTSILYPLKFLVDRPSGHIGPEVIWSPYWGCQRIDDWWAIWRGEEDPNATRKNMVLAKVALIRVADCSDASILEEAFEAIGHYASPLNDHFSLGVVEDALERLAESRLPVHIDNPGIAPDLIRGLWAQLWPNARVAISLRTQFNPESSDSRFPPNIVAVPQSLRPRWSQHNFLEVNASLVNREPPAINTATIEKAAELIALNADSLSGDFSIRNKALRIADYIQRIDTDGTPLGDTLIVIKSIESIGGEIKIPDVDWEFLRKKLNLLNKASIVDIRTASLTNLKTFGDTSEQESALADWAAHLLPQEGNSNALWILEQLRSPNHAIWWKRGISAGLTTACGARTPDLGKALWRWWDFRPESVEWIAPLIGTSSLDEDWLIDFAPQQISDGLRPALSKFCMLQNFPRLFTKSTAGTGSLTELISTLRSAFPRPEIALPQLIAHRAETEVLREASCNDWAELRDSVVEVTLARPSTLLAAMEGPYFIEIFNHHLKSGGSVPDDVCGPDTLPKIITLEAGQPGGLELIGRKLPRSCGATLLYVREIEQLIPFLQSETLSAIGEEWWHQLLMGRQMAKPPQAIVPRLGQIVSRGIDGLPAVAFTQLVELLPSVSERTIGDVLRHSELTWNPGDHERLAIILVARNWRVLAVELRRSWKSELQEVAWHARELLPWRELLWWSPKLSFGQPSRNTSSSAKGNLMGIDVGIITMKEEEYEALLDKFTPSETVRGTNRDYDVANTTPPEGGCRIAITRCALQGNVSAQTVVSEMIEDLSPNFILVVGIAGGIPTPDFCLGDVVVSDYIHDLTLEDSGSSNSGKRFNAHGGPLLPSATRIVERLRAHERNFPDWNTSDRVGCPRPELQGAYTTDDHSWNSAIDDALSRLKSRSYPIATAKAIASSDRLVKDPELVSAWRTILKGVSAIEMESAGVFSLCQRKGLPILAIRGISDIVGWHRDEAWTKYACHTAAAYTLMLVQSGAFKVSVSGG